MAGDQATKSWICWYPLPSLDRFAHFLGQSAGAPTPYAEAFRQRRGTYPSQSKLCYLDLIPLAAVPNVEISTRTGTLSVWLACMVTPITINDLTATDPFPSKPSTALQGRVRYETNAQHCLFNLAYLEHPSKYLRKRFAPPTRSHRVPTPGIGIYRC